MADQQHHIRIILEAVSRGGNAFADFFRKSEADIAKYRSSLQKLKKEQEEIFLFGGGRGRRTSSGRFDRERSSIERATLALRKFREEAKKEFAERQKTPIGESVGGFFAGRSERRQIEEEIDRRLFQSKQEKVKELDNLEKENFKRKQQRERKFEEQKALLERTTILQRKISDAERIDNLRLERQIIEDTIAADRKAKVDDNIVFERGHFKRLKENSTRLKQEIFGIEQSRDAFIRSERVKLAAVQEREKHQARLDEKLKKRAITDPDREIISREVFAEFESDLSRIENRFERFGRRAGRIWGDFTSGIRQGRRGLSDIDRDLLKSENRFRRFGAAIGVAISGAVGFVNVRWAIVISFLQILGTLVVQFGTALVALASSAVLAGAALGGAFLASLSQLVPVVGLLAASFSRLGAVLDAAQLSDKLRLTGAEDQKARLDGITQAAEKLSDAQFALKKAHEAVADAEFDLARSGRDIKDAYKDQKEAIEDLAEARKDATKAIVDANLNEKEAALALEEAELAVLEAKRRLREEKDKDKLDTANIADAQAEIREAQDRLAQARAEGDKAEITLALQQLSQAEQSLQEINNQIDNTGSSIKDAELGVRRSQINLQQARLRDKRAQEDAKKLREEGVEGSDRVKQAQERVVQSTRAIADAQRRQLLLTRQLRDAIHGVAIATRTEANARKDAAEATRKQTAQQEQLQQALGDLTPTERRLFRSIENIKKRYREVFRPITDIIVGAFARAVDRASTLLEDPKIIRAAQGLARVISGAIDTISRFTVSPEFRKFLEFSINQAAKNLPTLVNAFINLFKVFMRIATGAGPLLNRLFTRFEDFTLRIEKRTRNREGIEKFFSVAERHLNSWIDFAVAAGRLLAVVIRLAAPSGKTLLDGITEKLNEWADWLNSNERRVLIFFDNIAASVSALTKTLSVAIQVLFEAFSSENATALTQFILEVFIPAFTLFIDILGLAARGFAALTNIPILGDLLKLVATIIVVEKLFNRLIPATQKLTNLFLALVTGGFKKFIDVLAKEFPLVSKAFNEALLRSQILFERLTKAIRASTVAQLIHNAAVKASPYVRAAIIIAALIAILIGLELKFKAVTRTVKAVIEVFEDIFQFIKNNWKLLAVLIVAPFIGIRLIIIKFRDDILRGANAVIDFFRLRWAVNLASLIAAPFIGIIDDAYNFGRDLIQGLIDGVTSKAEDFKNRVIEIVKAPWNFVKSFFGIFSPSQWTKENIGIPLAEGITEGATEGLKGAGTEITFALRDELRTVEDEARAVRDRMINQVSNLRSLVSSQLGLKLQELTPAEKELQALDASENERSRRQQSQDAAKGVKEAAAEVEKANKELARAQRAFNNANTAEKKKQAKIDLQAAKQAQADAKKQLEEASKQQIETERQLGVERRRERLNILAQEQREALEKSVAAEQNRADKLVTAFANTLKGEPSKFKIARARSILDQIIGLIGGGKEGGSKAANEYIQGFLEQFNKFKSGLKREEEIITKRGKILAKQNEQAAGLLQQSTQTELIRHLTTKQPTRRGGTTDPKSDLEALQFLIATGNIDLPLARAIIGFTPELVDQKIFKRMLKILVPGMGFDNTRRLVSIIKSTDSPNDRLLQILTQIEPEDRTLDAFASALKGLQLFQGGGTVKGGAGQPVPVMAHAGEWILNKIQQERIAQALGVTIKQAQMLIFGTGMGEQQKKEVSNLKDAPDEKPFSGTTKVFGERLSFNLVPKTDPDGIVVWFIEMADGAFGQVSPKDAKKIRDTKGEFIPGYVRRSTHGFKKGRASQGGIKFGAGFAEGGVVQALRSRGLSMFTGPNVQSFAEGGTVLQQGGFGNAVSNTKNIEQNFNVTTQGETDWNYVLRLGAIHAQAGYT